MKILITGGAGFIGSHVSDALLREGHSVVVLDNLSHGKQKYISPHARFYHTDIALHDMSGIFTHEKPHVVIHNAAHINVPRSINDPVHDAEQNILASLRVLECARHAGVQKMIFASSGGAIYGKADMIPTREDYPASRIFSWTTTPYGIAKFTVESYLQYYASTHHLPFVSLRFANVYGPRQDAHGEGGVVAIFARKLLQGEVPTIYGNGEQTRDFVYVGDAVQAYLGALQTTATGFFNVSTGKETSVNTLYAQLAHICNVAEAPHYGPERQGDVRTSCLDAKKIQQKMGWKPRVSLYEGLEKTVAWMQWFYKINH